MNHVLRIVFVAAMGIGLVPTSVCAHHILGIPHYSYDEDYPQTPVLTYHADVGEYDVKMTGYPGKPEPGQRCSLHLYIHHRATGRLLDVPVTMTVTRDRLILDDPVVYGPMQARLDERIYKFHPHFDDEADYRVRVEFATGGTPWTIDFPLVVGDPESPFAVLGVALAGLVVLFVVVRAVRIKARRRTSVDRRRRAVAATVGS